MSGSFQMLSTLFNIFIQEKQTMHTHTYLYMLHALKAVILVIHKYIFGELGGMCMSSVGYKNFYKAISDSAIVFGYVHVNIGI